MEKITRRGVSNDGYQIPVRLYSFARQTKGSQFVMVYRVEFQNGSRWSEWYESEDQDAALNEFNTITEA